jgi:alpha-tubulin suppressor-like RCC1 family protein
VFSFGNNIVFYFLNQKNGQLGLGDNIDRNSPTLITSLSNIAHISSGGSHSMVLDNFGNIYSFGSNYVI